MNRILTHCPLYFLKILWLFPCLETVTTFSFATIYFAFVFNEYNLRFKLCVDTCPEKLQTAFRHFAWNILNENSTPKQLKFTFHDFKINEFVGAHLFDNYL
jgi:hypothetical protein